MSDLYVVHEVESLGFSKSNTQYIHRISCTSVSIHQSSPESHSCQTWRKSLQGFVKREGRSVKPAIDELVHFAQSCQ